ncbi:MAG: CshA/CshB family fibrillar adhesin-related protein [Bifidobacteriaceae bacterium]|jgi:hypothetical protein|nr:CshA/CshB family fibrillar adhesin-related protein [Bifidobacteriaceae bacterium]
MVLTYVGLNSVSIPPADAQFASGGSGRFPGVIDWFEWGAHDATLTAPMTVTNTRTVGGVPLVTTCSITSSSPGQIPRIKAYKPGTWRNDGLDNLYNVGGEGEDNELIAGIANAVRSATTSFKFSCSVTFGGLPAQVGGLVIADAESSSKSTNEYVAATPDGTGVNWRILDTYSACQDVATEAVLDSSNKLILRPNDEECGQGGGPTVVAFMEGATAANVEIKGGGVSAVALGVVTSVDMGDAPASYGQAGAIYQPGWTGGLLGVGTTLATPGEVDMAEMDNPATRLGATTDGEAAYIYSTNADADDDNGEDDEDVDFPPMVGGFIGSHVTVPGIECAAPGYVAGWIDFNSNGTFDATELSGPPSPDGVPVTPGAVACPANAGESATISLGWNVPDDSVEALGNNFTYARLRIASSQADAVMPTGFVFGGEVEDHPTHLSLPGLRLDFTNTGTQDFRSGDQADFALTVTNIGHGSALEGETVTVHADLSEIIDDTDYGFDACTNFAGEDCSYDPVTKVIDWTFVPPAPGDSFSTDFSATVKPLAPPSARDGEVNTVAWLEKAVPVPTPVCEIDEEEVWNQNDVACRATGFDMPMLTLEKTMAPATDLRIGQDVTYRVTATNTGQGDFTENSPAVVHDDQTAIDDDVPVLSTAVTEPAGVGELSKGGKGLQWTGALASGESIDIVYSGKVGPGGDTNMTNTAFQPQDPAAPVTPTCTSQVQGNDSTSGEACAKASNALPRLELTSDIQGQPLPVEGNSLTFSFTAENTGTGDFTQSAPASVIVDLSDALDNGTLTGQIAASLGQATVDQQTGLLTWTYPLTAGQSATVTWTLEIGEEGDSTIGSVGWATPDISDVEPPTCDAAWQAAGQCTIFNAERGVETPTLALTYDTDTSEWHNPVRQGDPIHYSFEITNQGNVTLNGVTPVSIDGRLANIVTGQWPDPTHPGRLLPGQSVTASATYVVTGANIVAGHATVAVRADATDPKGVAVSSADESIRVELSGLEGVSKATFEILTKTPLPADGLTPHQVRVELADAGGKAITGVEDDLVVAVDPSTAQITITETSTPGTYLAEIVSIKAGTYTVSGYLPGHATLTKVGALDTIVFAPTDPATITLTSATAGQVLPPGGTGVHKATVTVLDINDNPVPGVAVTFTVQPGGIVVSDPLRPSASGSAAATSVTGAEGTFTIEMTSPVIDTAIVTASANGQAIWEEGTTNPVRLELRFDYLVIPCTDPAMSNYSVTPNGPKVVGTTPFELRVHLETCEGEVMMGQADFLGGAAIGRSGEGDAVVSGFVPDPQQRGEYTATINSTAAGIKDLTILWSRADAPVGPQQIAPEPINGRDWVEFVPGDPSIPDGRSVFAVSRFDNQPVLTGRQLVYLHLEDGYGNTITDPAVVAKVQARALAGDATVGQFSASSNPPDGFEFEAEVSSAIAGSHLIGAYYTPAVGQAEQTLQAADGGQANRYANFVHGAASCAAIVVDPTGPQTAGSTFAAMVTVTDGAWNGQVCLGNKVSGADVELTANQVGGTGAATVTPSGALTTGSGGTAAFSVSSTKAGTFLVEATFTGQNGRGTANGSREIVFTPGEPHPTLSVLSLEGEGARTADGDATHAVKITLKDINLNPVPDWPVRFELFDPVYVAGQGPGQDATATTGPDGTATVYVRSLTPVLASPVHGYYTPSDGTSDVKLLDPETSEPQTVYLRFVPGTVDPKGSAFEVETRHQDPIPVVGVGEHRVVVVLNDEGGRPAQVDLALLGGRITIANKLDAPLTGWTKDLNDPTGAKYFTRVTSTVAGMATVRVTYADSDVSKALSQGPLDSDQAPFAAGPVHPDHSGFSVTKTPRVLADGEACQTATVTLADSYDNPITVDPALLDGSADPALVHTFAQTSEGTYQACITSTKSGSHAVQVVLDQPQPITIPGAVDASKATFVAGQAVPGKSTLTVTPQNPRVGDTVAATVTVRDKYDNLVPNQVVKLWLDPFAVPSIGGGVGFLTQTSGPVDSLVNPGQAQFTFTSTKVNTHNVHATLALPDEPPVKYSPTPVEFSAGDLASITLERLTAETAYVNSTPHQVKATLQDQFGNPIIGQSVNFSVSGLETAQMSPVNGAVDTLNDGTATIAVSSQRVGTASLTATVRGSTAQPVPSQIPLHFDVTEIDPEESEFWLSTGDRVANGSTAPANAHEVFVRLRDSFGTPIEDPNVARSISVRIVGPKGSATIGEFSPSSQVAGVFTALATSTVADTMTVTVNVNGTVPPRAGNTLTWVAGQVNLEHSSYAVATESVLADDESEVSVVVTLRDAHDNEVPGRAGDLKGSASPATVSGFTGQPNSGVYTAGVRSALAKSFPVVIDLFGSSSGTIKPGPANDIANFHAGPPAGTSELTIITQGPRAVTSEFHIAEVVVRDAKGNELRSSPVTFSVAGARPWEGTRWTATSDSNGIARFSFTADQEGTYPVHATVVGGDGAPIAVKNSGLTVEFVYGAISEIKSKFEVSQWTDVIADEAPEHFQEVTVWLYTEAGVGIAGRAGDIQAVVARPGAYLVDLDGNTPGTQQFIAKPNSPPGVYVGQIRSSVAGAFPISVTAVGKALEPTDPARDTAHFVAGPAVPGDSELSVDRLTQVAGGEIKATIKVFDARGNKVSNQIVLVRTSPIDAINPDGGTLPFLRVQTKANGEATATLSTKVAGTYTVYAELADGTAVSGTPVKKSGEIEVEFTHDAPSPTASILTGSSGQVLSNRVDEHWAKVKVMDQYGNAIDGVPVSFHLENPTGQAPIGKLVDGYSATPTSVNGGFAEVRYVGDFALGTTIVTARIGNQAVTNASADGSPAKLTWEWVPSIYSPEKSYYTVTPEAREASGNDPHTITIYLLDEKEAPVVGAAESLTVTAVPAPGSPARPDGTALTMPLNPTEVDKGVYEVSATSTYAATFNITAVHSSGGTIRPDPSNTPPRSSMQFVPGSPSETTSYFEVTTSPPDRKADGSAAHTLTAVVRDAKGNGVTGLNMAASDTANTPLLSVGTFTPGAAGQYTAPIRSEVAGTFTMTATATDGASAPVTLSSGQRNNLAVFVPGDACGQNSQLTATPVPALGDTKVVAGRGAWELRVIVRDCSAGRNPVNGQTVTFETVPDVVPALSPATAISAGGGVATLMVSSEKALTYLASAKVNGQAVTGSPTEIEFVAGAPDQLASTLTGTENERKVANNQAFHVATVTVNDIYGNAIAGQMVTISVADIGRISLVSPAGQITSGGTVAQATTNADGEVVVHIVSNAEAGFARVTAKIGDYTTGLPILSRPGVPASLALEFVPDLLDYRASYYSVSDGTRIAGVETHTVRVRTLDQLGTPVPLDDPAKELAGFAGPDATVVRWRIDPDSAEQATYIADIVSQKAGTYPVRVEVGGTELRPASGSTQTPTVTFVAGPASAINYWVSQTLGIRANNSDYQTVFITVADAFGNVREGDASRITATGEYSSIEDPEWDGDQYSAAIRSAKAGSHLVSVKFDGTDVRTSLNRRAVFVAGTPDAGKSELSVTTGSRRVKDESHTATVHVTDHDGNPVENQDVTVWTVPDTVPDSMQTVLTTDKEGLASIEFTTEKAGTYHVFAAFGTTRDGQQLRWSGERTVVFRATDISWTKTTLEATTTEKLVNNPADPHEATVKVRDRFDNPVTIDTSVQFALSGLPEASLSNSGLLPVNGDGAAKVTITSTKLGTARLTARVNGISVQNPPYFDLVFIHSNVSPADSSYSVTSGDRIANGEDSHELTVDLVDVNGAKVNGAAEQISVRLDANSPKAGPASIGRFTAVDGVDGRYVAEITSRSAATYAITVRVGDVIPPATGSPTSVRFVPGELADDGATFSVSTGIRIANGNSTGYDFHEVTVTLLDGTGNGMTGQKDFLHAEAPPFDIGDFEEDPIENPGVYVARITSTVAAARNVAVSFKGTVALTPGPSGSRVRFDAGPVSAERSTLEAITTVPMKVMAEEHHVRVTAMDKDGNWVQGATVMFSTVPAITDPAWQGVAPTNDKGEADLYFTSRVPGTYTVHATILGLDGVTQTVPRGSGEVQVEFITGPPALGTSWFTVTDDASVKANGRDSQTLSVFLADASGVGVPGLADADLQGTGIDDLLHMRLDKNGPVFGVFVEDSAKPGLYLAPITSTVAGTFKVGVDLAQSNGTALPLGLQVPSGKDTTLFGSDQADPTNSSLSVNPTQQEVTKMVTITATVKDRGGNAVVGQTVRFWVVDSDGNPVEFSPDQLAREPRTVEGGIASTDFTTTVAGTYWVHAALIDLPGSTGPVPLPESGDLSVEFTALQQADMDLSVLTGTDNERRVVGGADPEGIHTALVTVVDASPAHNPLIGLGVDFRRNGTSIGGDPIQTDANGQAMLRFTSDVAGDVELSARIADPAQPSRWIAVPARPAGTSRTTTHLVFGFDPGPWDEGRSSFEVSRGDKVADGVAAHTVTVTVRDAYGNGVPGMASQLSASADPAEGVVIGSFAAVNPARVPSDGLYRASIVSTRPGVKQIAVELASVTINPASGANSQAVFTHRPASLATSLIEIQAPRVLLANGNDAMPDSTIAIVTVMDDAGQPLGEYGAGLTIALSSNLPGMRWASLSGIFDTMTDNGDGTYSARLTSTQVGTATVRFSIGGARADSSDQVRFTEPPVPPTVEPNDGTQVPGQGLPGNTVTVVTEDGEPVGETSVSPDGTWKLKPPVPLEEGTMIVVTQTDDDGNVSDQVLWRVGQPRITVDQPELHHGEDQTVRVVNFQPGETVHAIVHSTPLDLGTAVAGPAGNAVFTFKVPAEFELGAHKADATGPLSGKAGPADFDVIEAVQPSPSPTISVTPTPVSTVVVPTHVASPVPGPTETVTVTAPGDPVLQPTLSKTGLTSGAIPAAGTALGLLLTGLVLLITKRRRDRQMH